MDPLTMAAAASVASAGLQYLNSEQARSANKEELARIQALVEKVKEPNFDFANLNAKEYAVVNKYMPEAAPMVEMAAPKTITASSQAAQSAKAARMKALQQMTEMADTGEDSISKIMQQQAMNRASQEAASQRGSLDQAFARRGQLGSGMNYASQLQAQSDAQARAAQAGQAAAMEAQRRRMQAIEGSQSMGSSIYGDETNLEAKNIGILNEFNRALADRRQEYANNRANTANNAQQINLAAAQKAADANVGLTNDRVNQANQLKQNQFGNSISKINLQSGAANQMMNQRNAAGQDRNQAIQSLGDVGSAYAMRNYQQEADDKRQAREDARWDKLTKG